MQEIRLIYRNSNSKDFRQPEEMHMKEQQEWLILASFVLEGVFNGQFVAAVSTVISSDQGDLLIEDARICHLSSNSNIAIL